MAYSFLIRPEFAPISNYIDSLIKGTYPTEPLEKERMFKVIVDYIVDYYNSHNQARKILESLSAKKQPFVLYLRSFNSELHIGNWSSGNNNWFSINPLIDGFLQSVQSFSWPYAFIGIKNVFSALGSDIPLFVSPPELSLPNNKWELIVDELIRASKYIVLILNNINPGISTELKLIRKARKQERTINLIWPTDDTTRNSLKGWGFQNTDEGVDLEKLIDFPHVLTIENYKLNDPIPSNVQDLIAKLRDDKYIPRKQIKKAIKVKCKILDQSDLQTIEYIDSSVEVLKLVNKFAKILEPNIKALDGVLPLDGMKAEFTDIVRQYFHHAHIGFGMSIALELYDGAATFLRYIAFIYTWALSDLMKAQMYLSMAKEYAALSENEVVIFQTKADLERNFFYRLGGSI
jgi:hypothetical protein